MSAVFDAATERGKITWHCSEEDGGPDVGLSLGLGDNRVLWVGAITKAAWSEGGEDVAALGGATGWWLILYTPESTVLGKLVNAEQAQDFIERMAVTIIGHNAGAGGEDG